MLEADYFWIMEAVALRKQKLIDEGLSPRDAERKAREEYEVEEDDEYE